MNILTVATAWGSKHGGVNVFNYRLCCALADIAHDVTCYVKEFTPDDLVDAQARRVSLKAINKPSDNPWITEDIGYVNYDELNAFDIILIHDIIAKSFLDGLPPNPKRHTIVSFIHTLYRDTDYLGDILDDERRARTNDQLSLIDRSYIVFTSGSWIAQQIIEDRPALKEKLRPFLPGRLDIVPCGGNPTGV